MELVVQVLMLFVVINTVTKLSFRRWWQAAVFGVICGAFVVFAQDWAETQSKTQLADFLSDRAAMQDVAVLITIEAVLSLSYCFAAMSGNGKRRWWSRALGWYPGLLIFPVLFYLLTQAIYALPGVSFNVVTYSLAAVAAAGMPLLSYLVRYLYPERELRLEVHFLVSLFVCVIGLITTVDGNVTYAVAEQPLNIKALFLSLAIFVSAFFIGIAWNKAKWIIRSKKQTDKKWK